jgi:hypothetical protein
MLSLICAACQKRHSYLAKEFVGRFFVCKHCRTVNLFPATAGNEFHSDINPRTNLPSLPNKKSKKKPSKKNNPQDDHRS